MAKAGTAYVEVVGDFSKLRRQLAGQMAGLGKDIKIDVDVDRRGLTSANRELAKTERAATGAGGAIGGLGRNLRKTGGEFISFKSRIPVAQLALMGAGAYNAAGGVIALTGALAPLTGLLGAVGPLATTAAQGIGTLKLATSGIGDAISAAFAEQDKAATSAAGSMEAAAAAADGVRAAQQALASAERQAKFAQEDLTTARAEATREIEDMRTAVRSLALEEEGASLSLKEAKQAFRELAASGAGELEIERASLRIKEAREELKKTQVEARRAKKDLGGVEAGGGVRGMPQVVSARRSLEDANRAVADSQRELVTATKQASTAMASGGGAADALAEKMAKLPPAARHFAKFIVGLRPKLKQLQATAAAGLFPGVERGIKAASKNLPVLEKIVGRTSKAFGDLAERAGKRLGSEEWGKDLETQGVRNERTIRRLGDSGLDLAEIFKDVTLAAGPLVDRLTKWVGTLTEGWKESANAGRETGRLQRFFKDAGDTFFKTVRILRDLGFAFKNIGSAARQAFGNDLLDSIGRGAANLRKWTESARGQRELVAIFTDIGDRLKRLGGFIKDLFGDFRRMRAEGQSAGDAIGQVFLTAIAKVIERAGELGVKFAVAFVKGFAQADVGGKLILAAFALSKFGLLGRTVGVVFGAGVAQGAAAGVVGGGAAGAGGGLLARLGSKLLPVAKRVGIVGLGIALADTTLKEFSRRAALKSSDAFKSLKAAQGPDPLGLFSAADKAADLLGLGDTSVFNKSEVAAKKLLPVLEEIAVKSKAISPKRADELREALAGIEGVSADARRGLEEIIDKSEVLGRLRKTFGVDVDADTPLRQLRRLDRGFSDLKDHTSFLMTTTFRTVNKNAKLIAETLGRNSKAGQQALRRNFALAGQDIQRLMRQSVATTAEGSAAIRKILVRALGTFGIKGAAAIKLAGIYGAKGLANLGAGNTLRGAPATGNLGGPGARQRGGPIDIGKPHGDSVPALLERGEYVLNRKAVQAVGKEQLDKINFKQASRFQSGGIVALGRKLQREGYDVGEHPAFGGVAPVHTGTSYHYRGQAIDVNADNFPGGEMAALDKLYARLKRLPGVVELLWRVKNHFDHLHVAMSGAGGALGSIGLPEIRLGHQKLTGEPSALKAQVAGALETVRGVGQRMIDGAQANMTMEGAEPVFKGGGSAKANRALGKRMAASFGWSGAEWSALDRLWTGESGWINQMNQAGSGATGIPQALPGSKMASEGADWQTNPATQIRWGLKYIKDVYGSPSNAYAQWLARDPHWYSEGGPVGLWGGGDPFDVIRSKAGKIDLAKSLRKTLRKVGGAKKPKQAKLLAGFIKKLEKMGLPKKLMGEIKSLSGDHLMFEDLAANAGGLTILNDDGSSIQGILKGLPEAGWVAKDLEAQFKMRNKLVRARDVAVKKRARVTRAFELARNRLKDLTKGGKTPHAWKGINPARDPIQKWNRQAQPKRMKGMRDWRRKHGSLPGTREFNERTGKLEAQPAGRVAALKKLVPALRNQRTLLNSGINGPEGIVADLQLLQGYGPKGFLRSPWPIGTIPGGSILQSQLRLRELGEKPTITDTAGDTAADERSAERADLLAQLLREANLRTAVSERQFDVLRNFPPFGGQFATGGVVPGPAGAPRTIIAHGGETVVPGGAAGQPPDVYVTFDGKVTWLRDFVDVRVEQKTRSMSRGRPLPGRAGGG